MVNIHMSAIPSIEVPLDKENISDNLEACAIELERLAADYKKMAQTIREKNIRIESVSGAAHCGTFEVDEIDTGRLKNYGLIKDYTDEPPSASERMSTFYVDPKFDTILDGFAEKLQEKFDESKVTKSVDELSDSLFGILGKSNPTGILNMGLTLVDGSIQIDVDDLGGPLPSVTYFPKQREFEFQCSNGEVHIESLENVYGSLVMATALISQLSHSAAEQSQEVGLALKIIEDNMRLLQHLLKIDYGVE